MFNKALDIAMKEGCRILLEKFGLYFVKLHHRKKLCTDAFGSKPTTDDIFDHFETCSGVSCGDKLLGDEIKLPTSGSFVKTFNQLSDLFDQIHSTLIKSLDGKVLVPDDLSAAEKRFYVRFLLAHGEEVAIFAFGDCRAPRKNEICFPPFKAKPITFERLKVIIKQKDKTNKRKREL